MTTDLVFNRFRTNTVAGRMLTALAKRPMTVKELARVAEPKSAANILAPGGWYFQLRRFGKSSRKFNLSVADNGRLVMKVNPRYRGQVA